MLVLKANLSSVRSSRGSTCRTRRSENPSHRNGRASAASAKRPFLAFLRPNDPVMIVLLALHLFCSLFCRRLTCSELRTLGENMGTHSLLSMRISESTFLRYTLAVVAVATALLLSTALNAWA